MDEINKGKFEVSGSDPNDIWTQFRGPGRDGKTFDNVMRKYVKILYGPAVVFLAA
jgi:hypothetical protein